MATNASQSVDTKAPGGTASQGVDEAVTDPVCGMPLSGDEHLHVEYGGKSYSFCSTSCSSQFASDPQRYAK